MRRVAKTCIKHLLKRSETRRNDKKQIDMSGLEENADVNKMMSHFRLILIFSKSS